MRKTLTKLFLAGALVGASYADSILDMYPEMEHFHKGIRGNIRLVIDNEITDLPKANIYKRMIREDIAPIERAYEREKRNIIRKYGKRKVRFFFEEGADLRLDDVVIQMQNKARIVVGDKVQASYGNTSVDKDAEYLRVVVVADHLFPGKMIRNVGRVNGVTDGKEAWCLSKLFDIVLKSYRRQY